jgi:hypothetical protein
VTGPSAEVAAAQERRRRRPVRRTLLVGGGLSLAGAVLVGVLGGTGAGGLTAALVGTAMTSGVGGVVALGTAVRDEYRGERVPRGRILVGVGLLLGAPISLMLAAGAASAA